MVTFTINIPPMLAYIPYMDPMGYICLYIDIYNNILIYIYIYIHLYIYIYTWELRTSFCWSIMVYPDLFVFKWAFAFLIVSGCSNGMTAPGSDILRQPPPKEELQPKMAAKFGCSHKILETSRNSNHISTIFNIPRILPRNPGSRRAHTARNRSG